MSFRAPMPAGKYPWTAPTFFAGYRVGSEQAFKYIISFFSDFGVSLCLEAILCVTSSFYSTCSLQ